ncbi:TldD/PmbA family protein [Trichothermofontia sp.]
MTSHLTGSAIVTLTTASPLPSADEALALIDAVLAESAAETAFVSFSVGEEALSRFSENQMTQNLSRTHLKLTVTSHFGQRSGSSATTDLDWDSLRKTLRRSEDLARIAPVDPEWVPPLPPQDYGDRPAAFDTATATLSPLTRGQVIQAVGDRCRQAGVEGAGTFSTEASLLAIGNSLGLRAAGCWTEARFNLTARIADGSAWDHHTDWAWEALPIVSLTEQVIAKAMRSRQPRVVAPGVYPVILSGAAVAELLSYVLWHLDARSADEGRSFMSRTDATGNPTGNRLGELLFSPLVTLHRDPSHPRLQTLPFSREGLPRPSLPIIQAGVPQTLAYSRYWAMQQGQPPTGSLFPAVMMGSDHSLEDLIAQSDRAILISRAWYVGQVNSRTLEVTGMTRDGTFWIENGQIAYPIKNLRFNQCLPEMLRDIDALGTSQRYGSLVVPAVRVKAFRFSSGTDSV